LIFLVLLLSSDMETVFVPCCVICEQATTQFLVTPQFVIMAVDEIYELHIRFAVAFSVYSATISVVASTQTLSHSSPVFCVLLFFQVNVRQMPNEASPDTCICIYNTVQIKIIETFK